MFWLSVKKVRVASLAVYGKDTKEQAVPTENQFGSFHIGTTLLRLDRNTAAQALPPRAQVALRSQRMMEPFHYVLLKDFLVKNIIDSS